MKQWFSKQKIKHKIYLMFLIILGIYLMLFFAVYHFVIREAVVNYTLKSNLNTMTSIASNLEGELTTIDHMSQLILTNQTVDEYLQAEGVPNLAYKQAGIQSVYNITNLFNYVSSVYVFRNDGRFISAGTGVTDLDLKVIQDKAWLNPIYEAAGGYLLQVNGAGAFTRQNGEDILSFIRVMNDLETQKPKGILVINLEMEVFEQTYNKLNDGQRKYQFYTRDNQVLSDDKVNLALKNLAIGSKPYHQKVLESGGILSYYQVQGTPFVLKGYERGQINEAFSNDAGTIALMFLGLTLLALFIIGLFISRFITHPIESLAQAMKTVNSGWLRRLSLDLAEDEIGYLKDAYNTMLVEINELIAELIEKEKSIQQAEMDVLQEQIKPHFLYNILSSIGDLALEEEPDKVYQATMTLSHFYRLFLSSGEREITLKQEVAIAKDYLTLQKIRYGDIFEMDIYLDADIEEIKIPKLTLQPLIENSLYHGIRLKGEKGLIRIGIQAQDQVMELRVYDTGIGMSQEEIKGLLDGKTSKHFGFSGTLERLNYAFKSGVDVRINSQIGQYTDIIFKINLEGR